MHTLRLHNALKIVLRIFSENIVIKPILLFQKMVK